MNRFPPQRISMLTVLTAFAFASSAMAMGKLGEAAIAGASAVRFFDAKNAESPVLTDQTQVLPAAGSHVTVDDFLFVADGSRVRAYDRETAALPERAVWSSERPILSLADGPERGLLLVLTDQSLDMVRFPDGGAPSLLWSYPVPQPDPSAAPGRLLVRDGRQVYVADPSVPGVRVLTLDPSAGPATAATWHCQEGPVRQMSLWNRTLTVLTSRSLIVLDAGGDDGATLRRLGTYETAAAPAALDANSRFAFVGSGSTVEVFDIDPSSPGFLQGAVDRFEAQGTVGSLCLDKMDRLYTLEAGRYEIVGVSPFGGR